MEEPHTSGVEAVQVWVAPLDVPPSVLFPLVASLSPAERARAERYRYDRDGRRFSAAHGWLRQVLGAAAGIPPADVALTGAPLPGKPRLAAGMGPCFNLSRARDLALIAVAPYEVGVDVEHADRGRRGLDAASVACSAGEAAALRRLPPSARADAFLARWTAKEAYLKATGQGLSFPPHQVEVGREGPDGAMPIRVAGAPSGWWARQLRPAPGYVGAVVAEGRAWEIRMRSTTELPTARPSVTEPR